MDNRYYSGVIEEMKPFFDENGFKLNSEGAFENENRSIKVEYDNERQMYVLKLADIEEGKAVEYIEANAWLFDDTQNEKDAAAVGIDFTNTLREKMGIKLKRQTSAGSVDLPTANKNGDLNVSSFTKKVLDVFPQYKDSYKEHIAKYGNFLYMNFFGETLVPQIKATLKEGNKKQVKKLFDMLENAYVHGDKDTVNVVVSCVAAAVCGDEKLISDANAALGDNEHFKSCVSAFIPVVSKNKKLRAALVK